MPVIYLEHPRHGQKVAMAESEALYDEGHGWRRFTPGATSPSEPVEALTETDEIPAFLNAMVTPRRGRPPKSGN